MTTTEEAIAILEQTALINFAEISPMSGTGVMSFRFNRTDSLIDSTVPGYLYIMDDRVQWLSFQTEIPLGELWATYGQADWLSRSYPMGSDRMIYNIGYDESMMSFDFFVRILSDCSASSFHTHLRERVLLRLGTDNNENVDLSPTL